MLKVTRGPVRFFYLRNYLVSFFNNLNTQISFFFFNFNAPIFYNFPNLIFFGFLKFFLINKFCKFVNLRKNFNYENLIIFETVEILKEFQNYQIQKLTNFQNYKDSQKIVKFWIVRRFDISHYSQFLQFSYLSFDIDLFRSFIYLSFHFIFQLLS